MATLVAKNPSAVLTIRQLSPNIHTISLPFLRFSRIPIGGRCTIARLTNNTLAVFSPVSLTPQVRQLVNSLSAPVAFLVAPDIEHHLFLTEWATEFPEAELIGPHGLEAKRAKQALVPRDGPQITDIKFAHTFTPENHRNIQISPSFDDTFSTAYLPTHKNREIALFHKADKTLIQADIVFNLPAEEQYCKCPEELAKNNGILTKIFLAIAHMDPTRPFWPRFLQYYVFGSSDRKQYGESVKRIASWDFDTMVPCHGEVIQGGAKERFCDVMKWFLDDKSKDT